MYYLKGVFTQKFDPRCHVQYCEIGDDLFALRSVEKLWDGRLGYSSVEQTDGTNGVYLPQEKFPHAKDIWDSKNEFHSEIISKAEFEKIWLIAKNMGDSS
ncbi:hypothetical protein SAMN04488117_11860 [Celeribacter baekdonensis]|uniref:DUF6881 domain-containing protein n=1 Tax=Celeribacter baekdonensis TaxID=875171 RepID=A0A1G7TTN9_9RHOB|nr:hypothetical protein [Celeribacter baekdonensis]SDG38374.1 hypothetical protein SAMN04488117_11860 [Celeribacter baekdonensis]